MMNRRRRTTRSWSIGLESLEQRQLLTGTNDGGQDSDAQLAAWRDTVRQQLIEQADASYGERFGTDAPEYGYWLEDNINVSVFRNAVDFATGFTASAFELSDTNTQVAGIDEADIVETDGTHIFALAGKELVIATAANSDTTDVEIISRTELSFQPRAMFLHEGRLTILGDDYVPHDYSHRGFVTDIAIWNPLSQRTVISSFDVSDPTEPSLAQETIVDGSYADARAIGDRLFVVINSGNGIPYLPRLQLVEKEDTTAEDESATGSQSPLASLFGIARPIWDVIAQRQDSNYRYQTRDEFLAEIDKVVAEASPPSIYQRGQSDALERIGLLDDGLPGDELQTSQGSRTSIVEFDMNRNEAGPVDHLAVAGTNAFRSQIYASENAIYLLSSQYRSPEVDGIEVPQILRIDGQYTKIARIAIAGESLEHTATGEVRGNVDSQFSVDEHNGFLRIATTTWSPIGESTDVSRESNNHLWVLEQQGEELAVVGSVINLAPTEIIYSMRYDGDRAWMVTFRQIDPVFSFDLSDPTNPVVTGELKIPGFSDYLQLIDENTLLAVGRSGNRQNAVEVSLFDVSDMTAPALLHRYTFSGRWQSSEASYDHQAFNYIASRNILAIPHSSNYFNRRESVLALLSIDREAGIELVAEVEQDTAARRSIVVDDKLHAITNNSIAVVDLDDPTTVIDAVPFIDNVIEPRQHGQLLERMLQRGRRVFAVDFGDVIGRVIGVGNRPDDWAGLLDSVLDGEVEYEFRVLNAASGDEITTLNSNRPFAQLDALLEENEGGLRELLADVDSIQVQTRRRDNSLTDAEWSDWTDPQTIVLKQDRPLVTDTVLPALRPILKWAGVPDQGEVSQSEAVQELITNAIERYEVWVTDAETREKTLHTEVDTTELDLSELGNGKRMWVWLRGIFEDGSKTDWSPGTTIRTRGEAPVIEDKPIRTGRRLPRVLMDDLPDAAAAEVELTHPDGTVEVLPGRELGENGLKLANELPAGDYSIRVRLNLLNAVETEWSAPQELTIVGRPELKVDGLSIDLDDDPDPAETTETETDVYEVWVNRKANGEQVFHSRDWTVEDIADAADAFQLDEAGPDDYAMWVRQLLPDGSMTDWSPRAIVQTFVDAIPTENFANGEAQELKWRPAAGVENFEVFVRKVGEVAARVHDAAVTGNRFELPESLEPGQYEWWVRGEREGGRQTRWSPRQRFTVVDAVPVTLTDNVLTWPAATDANTVFEVWVNRVNENGRLLQARTLHEVVEGDSLDLNGLSDGNYRIWMRSVTISEESRTRSEWTRVDFQKTTNDISQAFVDSNDLLAAITF